MSPLSVPLLGSELGRALNSHFVRAQVKNGHVDVENETPSVLRQLSTGDRNHTGHASFLLDL